MNDTCGCCEGTTALTPEPINNRPSLDALSYRAGIHATFFETMKARLSTADHPELRDLTTRDSADPAIALLDAWALVADVLTFYQERIANEGYLRTAIERRSILELARLVGYTLRPGVAASTYLAFTLEDTVKDEVEIPVGTRAQSLPGPGELPQPFESAEPLKARTRWNRLTPRLSRPQTITSDTIAKLPLYLQGISTNLKPNDPLLVDFGDSQQRIYRVVRVTPSVEANRTAVQLEPWVKPVDGEGDRAQALVRAGAPAPAVFGVTERINQLAGPLLALAISARATVPLDPRELALLANQLAAALLDTFRLLVSTPPSPARDQNIAEVQAALLKIQKLADEVFEDFPSIDVIDPYVQLIRGWLATALAILDSADFQPLPDEPQVRVADVIEALLAPTPIESLPLKDQAYLVRDLATVFALNSEQFKLLQMRLVPQLRDLNIALRGVTVPGAGQVRVYALRARVSLFGYNVPLMVEFGDNNRPKTPDLWLEWTPKNELADTLFLDNAYDAVLPDGFVAILTPGQDEPTPYRIKQTNIRNRSDYGIAAKTTEVQLKSSWWSPILDPRDDFGFIRGSVVYAASEELILALEPDTDAVGGGEILLDGVYDGLPTGRWLTVTGERTNLRGVVASELVMLGAAEQIPPSSFPNDVYRTRLQLANTLRNSYKRETVVIYGNVVRATHGETRTEVLGSGDGSKALQRFTLRQSPLTYLAAPTPAGAESTLVVRVDNIRWHESERMAALGPTDHSYILRTDDEQKTAVIFGNGQNGARLPTGIENIKAVYRSGIGKVGNVRREQISLLATRPYGVKSVINPLVASGGADRESRDQARRNVPLAVMALDRLVSTQDYADFARTYAGINKASAARLSDGQRQIVHLTIAGADDIPIEETSDLYRNLSEALRRYGDPFQPFRVELRELAALFVRAKIRIHPDYLWEKVEQQVRATLLDTFGFERRDLGQDVLLSEVISAIQHVEGVTYVDVDLLDSIAESTARDPELLDKRLQELAESMNTSQRPRSRIVAELARPDPQSHHGILRAQLVFLLPDVPETLLLEPIP